MRPIPMAVMLCVLVITGIVALRPAGYANDKTDRSTMMSEKPDGYPLATLAGGCFWCLESEFRGRTGIVYTVVGYTGGHIDNPTYEQVGTATTGHAEAVEIYYDPALTSYHDILEYFLTAAHDPTQTDGQWVDKGPQYRSVIFYHDDVQRQEAEEMIATLSAQKYFQKPIATAIEPARTFWPAEEYHQQYYEKYEERTGQEHIRVYLKEQNKQNRKK